MNEEATTNDDPFTNFCCKCGREINTVYVRDGNVYCADDLVEVLERKLHYVLDAMTDLIHEKYDYAIAIEDIGQVAEIDLLLTGLKEIK